VEVFWNTHLSPTLADNNQHLKHQVVKKEPSALTNQQYLFVLSVFNFMCISYYLDCTIFLGTRGRKHCPLVFMLFITTYFEGQKFENYLIGAVSLL